VNASGANILPSSPWSVNSGRNTTMMMAMPNRIGRLIPSPEQDHLGLVVMS